MYSFSTKHGRVVMSEWFQYRRVSRGWQLDPPAFIYTNILFGSAIQLTPEFVKQHRITHVINCALENDSPEWFRTTYPQNYYCVGAHDTLDSNIIDWFPQFESTMNEFIQTADMIFIHCQCGVNRSGFLALLYACKKFNYTWNDAVHMILSQRPCALTNPSFRKQTLQYIENLRTR